MAHYLSKKDELIQLAISETGKTEFDGILEILTTLEIMRFNRKMAPRALASEVRPLGLIMKNKRGTVHYRPYGVEGAISPWNYPLIQPTILVVPALLAGNGIVLKPSEFTTLTALKMKERDESTITNSNDFVHYKAPRGAFIRRDRFRY